MGFQVSVPGEMSKNSARLLAAIGTLVANAIDEGVLESAEMARNVVECPPAPEGWAVHALGREITLKMLLPENTAEDTEADGGRR